MGFYLSLYNSVQCAFIGFLTAWKEEGNFRIECVCAVLVVFLGWLFQLSGIEFAIIIAVIGLVLSLELLNTAVENLADMIDVSHNLSIKKIKDISAAGVFIASVSAFCVGVIIFVPYFLRLFS